MKMNFRILAPLAVLLTASCGLIEEAQRKTDMTWTLKKDLTLLNEYADCQLIKDGESMVVVSPKLQGRVMVASLDGVDGDSLGWYNRKMIVNGVSESANNIIGGMDRFSLAPEGGETAFFFKQGDAIVAENWKAPAFLSSEAWQLTAKDTKHIMLEKSASVLNAKGTKFDLKVERQISILNKSEATELLGASIPKGIDMVAFQTINKITNQGDSKWNVEDGVLAQSIQSCFTAGNDSYAFIPYVAGDDLGKVYNDQYFSNSEDFRFKQTDKYLRLRVDAKKMIEVGLNPKRSKSIALAYDADTNILTIVTYIAPPVAVPYITNTWKRTESTLDGDAISVFNDGVAAQGSFDFDDYFEITTNSPALALGAKQSQLHVHRVFQFYGSEYELGILAESIAGIGINELMVEE